MHLGGHIFSSMLDVGLSFSWCTESQPQRVKHGTSKPTLPRKSNPQPARTLIAAISHSPSTATISRFWRPQKKQWAPRISFLPSVHMDQCPKPSKSHAEPPRNLQNTWINLKPESHIQAFEFSILADIVPKCTIIYHIFTSQSQIYKM